MISGQIYKYRTGKTPERDRLWGKKAFDDVRHGIDTAVFKPFIVKPKTRTNQGYIKTQESEGGWMLEIYSRSV